MKNLLKVFETAKRAMLILVKYRMIIMLTILAALSIYKPLALFQHLGLVQTAVNICMNMFVYYTVGAAVFMHNLILNLL